MCCVSGVFDRLMLFTRSDVRCGRLGYFGSDRKEGRNVHYTVASFGKSILWNENKVMTF